MYNADLNKIVFYSKEDMAGGWQLQKGEPILRADIKSNYTDINEVLELYNLKKYIDNDLYLKNWTPSDIADFKQKAISYGKEVGKFMATINDCNVMDICRNTWRGYIPSFWELVNNQSIFKQISETNVDKILENEPHLIREILTHHKLVAYYDKAIKNFLLSYPQSAEILISVYEAQNDFHKILNIPKSLTIPDKETIISDYLDSNNTNPNYIRLIYNARNRNDFKVSDKIRLKAKRLYDSKTKELLIHNSTQMKASITFSENTSKLKEIFVDENQVLHYCYSLNYIQSHCNDFYILFENFKELFEYVDTQKRIGLVSKISQMSILEKCTGVPSKNEYRIGSRFLLNETISHGQIAQYSQILNSLNIALEAILRFVFTTTFQDKYGFASNASFVIPSVTNTHFEKVRLLAPEFESILKQYKLFVEDDNIDFDLLQISSNPLAIRDVPSLNQNKYIYFNADKKEMVFCLNLLFSDQSGLTHIEPFINKGYSSFFNLLESEHIYFNNYEEFQQQELNYLINKKIIFIDVSGSIQITNRKRLLILKDLYENEVASFPHYPIEFQNEVIQMATENILLLENSLFSKPEQEYFNYFLNKSEFTNGLDLRNSYLHGTQAKSDEIYKHEKAYFTYLKLLFLAMLKIEDDLMISDYR